MRPGIGAASSGAQCSGGGDPTLPLPFKNSNGEYEQGGIFTTESIKAGRFAIGMLQKKELHLQTSLYFETHSLLYSEISFRSL